MYVSHDERVKARLSRDQGKLMGGQRKKGNGGREHIKCTVCTYMEIPLCNTISGKMNMCVCTYEYCVL